MVTAKEYTTDRIRNVAVLGHGGSGKTSLVDALCFVSGSSRRHGSVDDGTALTMHAPEEHAHGISLQLTPAYAEHLGTKINLLDTPGYLDFTGEALAAVRVADAAIIVVSATSGVEVGTERVWRYCVERGIPRIFFVSGMDKEHADFEGVFRQIKTLLTDKALPVEIPVGEGPDFHGIINLFSEKAHLYKEGTTTGEYDEVEVPEEYAPDGGEDEIFLADIDGKNARNLTKTEGNDGHPWFSRDGKTIVFESDRTGMWEIWKIDLETGKQTQLTDGKGRYHSTRARM